MARCGWNDRREHSRRTLRGPREPHLLHEGLESILSFESGRVADMAGCGWDDRFDVLLPHNQRPALRTSQMTRKQHRQWNTQLCMRAVTLCQISVNPKTSFCDHVESKQNRICSTTSNENKTWFLTDSWPWSLTVPFQYQQKSR